MKKVLIVSIKYKNGLYSIQDDFPLNVKSILEKAEIKYIVFREEALTNINELAEEIVEENCETVLFFSQPSCYRLVQILANKIYNISTSNKIYLYSDKKQIDYNFINIKFVNNDNIVQSLMKKEDLLQNKNYREGFLSDYKYALQGKEEFQAMYNGYISYITGIYPESVVNLSSKHIGCDKVKDNKYDEALTEYLNINSAIIEKSDNYSIDVYNDRINYSAKKNVFIPHYHQKVVVGNSNKVYIDYSSNYIDTIECNYAEFYRLQEDKKINKDILYVVSINCKDDLEYFLDHIKLFETKGIIKYSNFILKDECRWQMKCNLKYLPRININSDGNIRPCIDSKITIGTIKDSYYVNIRKAAKHIDKEYIQRVCRECNIKNICSKCSILPDFIERDEYCDIRRKNPLILDFLDKKNMYYYLLKFSDTIDMKNIDNIRFSNSSYSSVFPSIRENGIDVSKKVYLIFLNNKPLLFNYEKNSLFEIDESLAFILEGYLKNYDEDDINIFFKQKYGVDSEESSNIVNRGFELLRNEGIIR